MLPFIFWQKKIYKDQMEYMLQNHVFPLFSSELGYMRARVRKWRLLVRYTVCSNWRIQKSSTSSLSQMLSFLHLFYNELYTYSRDEYQFLHVIIDNLCVVLKWLQHCVHSFPSVSGGRVCVCFAHRLYCSHKTCGQRWTWDHSTGLVMSAGQPPTDQPPHSQTSSSLKSLTISLFNRSFTSDSTICVGYAYTNSR